MLAHADKPFFVFRLEERWRGSVGPEEAVHRATGGPRASA